MKRELRRYITTLTMGAVLLSGGTSALVLAQTASPAGSGLQYSAPHQLYTQTGMRLEGTEALPAHLWSPGQLDVKARVISFDVTLKPFVLSKVQATKNVSFDLKIPARGTTAGSHINATSDAATLGPAAKDGKRILTLTGNVNGYYEVGGARNILQGTSVTITIGTGAARSFEVAIEGGANGVRLEIPAQMFASAPGNFNGFDSVVITGERATLDQTSGTARIVGKARAEGKAKAGAPTSDFLVTANDFVITRNAAGQMDALQTVGRTKMKIDLPPSPTPTAAATATPATTTPATTATPTPEGTAPEGTAPAPTSNNPGMPTSMEAEADKATVTFSDSKLVFEGNVKGQYELRTADGTANRYNFNGDKVVVRSLPKPAGDLPAGTSVEAFGKPVTVELPNIGLGLE